MEHGTQIIVNVLTIKENSTNLEHGELYKIGTKEENKLGTKRTIPIWSKENSINLEHREQYKFGTWRTVQIWNMKTSTNLEQGEQYKF